MWCWSWWFEEAFSCVKDVQRSSKCPFINESFGFAMVPFKQTYIISVSKVTRTESRKLNMPTETPFVAISSCGWLFIAICVSLNLQTLVAKKWHFAYSTPLKTSVFRSSIDLRDVGNSGEVEPPNAPKQRRPCSSRLIRKNVCNISVALFTSPDE